MNSAVRIDGVAKVFYDRELETEVQALKDVDLEVAGGEFLCLIGPSGCGKSTLLNMIAGFIPPTRGRVLVEGKEVEKPGPDRGVVFQEYTLFPWLTVSQNVEFGLKNMGMPRAERREKAAHYLELVGLEDFIDSRPFELSGGMKQRVAIARVLAMHPNMLLMDEPFGALDAQTRQRLQEELLTIWRKEKKTVIFVTHNVDEAVFLADRIVVLTSRPGQVKRDLKVTLDRPRDRFGKSLSEIKRELLVNLMDEAFFDHGRRDDGWSLDAETIQK